MTIKEAYQLGDSIVNNARHDIDVARDEVGEEPLDELWTKVDAQSWEEKGKIQRGVYVTIRIPYEA